MGMAQCLFFAHAPKALAASLYVALGWAVLPFVGQYQEVLSSLDVALVVAGGVIYSFGVRAGGREGAAGGVGCTCVGRSGRAGARAGLRSAAVPPAQPTASLAAAQLRAPA